MSSLKFEMEDITESKLTEKTFHLLSDFLQPDSALKLNSIAQTIMTLLPERAVGSSELRSFNLLIFEFGEQIPYYHPSQHKLAALMERLGESPKLTHIIGDVHLDWMGGALRDSTTGILCTISKFLLQQANTV